MKTKILMTALLATLTLPVMAENKTKVEYEGMPVQSAVAPSVSSVGSDMCRSGISAGTNTGVFSVSGGMTVVDKNCERIRNAKMLDSLGMKIGAISLMCQSDEIFKAMLDAGSPCPIEGLQKEEAIARWKEVRPEMFRDYEGEVHETTTVSVSNNPFNQ
jgi:hypothetical protein